MKFPKMNQDMIRIYQEQLLQLAQDIDSVHLNQLFAVDTNRFVRLSRKLGSLCFDFSKQKINQAVLDALCDYAEQHRLSEWIKLLFSGAKVNYTENRSAMHWALRLPKNHEHTELSLLVHEQLDKMTHLVKMIHSGQYRGATGEIITDVVNIGVGGSDLGPLMASAALVDYRIKTPQNLHIHFVSTMDGSQLSDILYQLKPEKTLFIISSKSFTTIDTLSNAKTARAWLQRDLGTSSQINQCHFIGVSADKNKMTAWGIPEKHQLQIWEWVGGRYSLWSCIGLPIALTIGMDYFYQFLAGGYEVDQHVQITEFSQNIPVLLALIGFWNSNFLNIQTHAVLSYDGRLKYLHQYLQQLEMESNGKSINYIDEKISYTSCPIIWGEVGPNAQHAFYQLLHQGTQKVSSDFIAAIKRYHDSQGNYVHSATELKKQHYLTLANCLAQSRLLAFGNEALSNEDLQTLPKYKQYGGDQPSSTLLLDALTPKSLGMLIAIYEHKVFIQSVLWSVNSFDQWGVEKGKEIAKELLPFIGNPEYKVQNIDLSTWGLIQEINKFDS